MIKRKKVGFVLCITYIAAVILWGPVHVLAQDAESIKHADGIIRLGSLQRFAPLERPAVLFPHDLHTSADSIVDCRECHNEQATSRGLLKDGGIMFTYLQTEKCTSKKDAMNMWHAACLGCHKRTFKAGKRSGPVACGLCHRKGVVAAPIHPVTDFYNEQHDTHTDALDGGCESCHHDYDPETGKLQYVQDAETACSECHKNTAENGTPSIKDASHLSCINCHLDMEAGPVKCGECHQLSSSN